ncbi:MAG: translation initiation factor IF-2 N-terminal domain-containing protein, partial [Campylobacterales bacterium]
MDNKVKVKEIADELGIKPKEVLDICTEFKIEAKNHSSAITMEDAEKVMNFFMKGERPAGFEAPKPEPKPVVEKQAEPKEAEVKESEPKVEAQSETESRGIAQAPRDRKNFEIIKKANPTQIKPEVKKEEPKREEPKKAQEQQPKKPKPQPIQTSKKPDGIKISIDREFAEKDEDNDDLVMLPDFSIQDKFLEDEEKPVPTKTATAENQKAKVAVKKPQPKINTQ